MTDDDLLCSEADIVKAGALRAAFKEALKQNLTGFNYAMDRYSHGPDGMRRMSDEEIDAFRKAHPGSQVDVLAEPATDPYEIEKD